MTNSHEKVLGKIRALLAKTEAAGCTEAEALSAAALATKLLDKHSLSMTDADLREVVCVKNFIDTGRQNANELCKGRTSSYKYEVEAGRAELAAGDRIGLNVGVERNTQEYLT